MNRLKDKVVVLTGANSGIGEAAAQALAAEGAMVVLAARRIEPLQAVAEKIKADGGQCLAVPTDISSAEGCEKLIAAAVETFGKLDVLVNNAGVLEKGLKPIDKFTDEDLDMTLNINTKGTMYLMRAAALAMEKSGGGSMVNVASVAGAIGCGGAAYVASKAALIGVARHTALRYAGKNIRCNTICPGSVMTPMAISQNPAELDQNMMGQMQKHNDLTVPICMAQDVANIILFLASDESKALTGQVLIADFGSTL